MTKYRILAVAVTLSLVSAFLFSGLLHSFVPHSHDGSEAQTQAMHAAMHHDKTIVILFTTLYSVVLWIAIATISFLAVPVLAAELEYLRRGIALYRRFG